MGYEIKEGKIVRVRKPKAKFKVSDKLRPRHGPTPLVYGVRLEIARARNNPRIRHRRVRRKEGDHDEVVEIK
jgi:hypothetical protein